ncbi:hypothetical protein RIF29_28179 [Crotalaria pallida]|uniref:Uncharacterized protein n=1 Tax=Crotalaria pallida TaxID=3830 RepID=A0AAN9EST3_CROPI
MYAPFIARPSFFSSSSLIDQIRWAIIRAIKLKQRSEKNQSALFLIPLSSPITAAMRSEKKHHRLFFCFW